MQPLVIYWSRSFHYSVLDIHALLIPRIRIKSSSNFSYSEKLLPTEQHTSSHRYIWFIAIDTHEITRTVENYYLLEC